MIFFPFLQCFVLRLNMNMPEPPELLVGREMAYVAPELNDVKRDMASSPAKSEDKPFNRTVLVVKRVR
jgi:hypothetical protein